MEEKDTKKAPSGKGKGKGKKQTVINLNDFQNAGNTQAGFIAVPAVRWSDVCDNDDEDANEFGKTKDSMVILPTAPKSIRGPDIDVNQVPTEPPFICYLSNLPFEASEDDIRKFFRDLKIVRIDLARDPGVSGRARGQGTCEFEDRQSLIEAFNFNQETIKNRPVRVNLRSWDQERDNFRRERDGDREDRTAGDWRSGAGKSDLKPMSNFGSNRSYQDSNSFGNRNREGGGYNQRGNYGDSSSSYDRPQRNYGNDNNYGNRQSNRMDRNYNNNSYQNYPSDMDSNRGEFSRESLTKSVADSSSYETRTDEPVRERVKLVLNKPTKPRPELQPSVYQQQPPLQAPSSTYETNSNRSESESSETARRSISQEPERPVERRKLVLLPPSKKENSDPVDAPAPAKPNPSIFGEAKPVDTTKRLQEIETKVQQHEQEIEKELIEKLEKQPLSESGDAPVRERGNRDYDRSKRLSDTGSHSSGGGRDYDRNNRFEDGERQSDNRSFHNRDYDRNRFDDSYRRQGGNRRMNQQHNNNYSRDGRDNSYRDRGNKYNNIGNRNMNDNDLQTMDDHKRMDQDYDQRPNRMSGNGANRSNRQTQEVFQSTNKYSLLKEVMD